MNCESKLSHKCVAANYYRAVTVSIIKPSTIPTDINALLKPAANFRITRNRVA